MTTSMVCGVVGAALATFAGGFYVYDIVFGRTRPHRVSWAVWSLIALLGVGGTVEAGAGTGAYVAIVYLVTCISIFALSLMPRYGKPGGEPYDIYVGIGAVATLIVWRAADLSPATAVIAAVTADSAVAWLTLRAAWRQPATESTIAWTISAVAAVLGALAFQRLTFSALLYPVYLAVGNSLIAGALLIRSAQWMPSFRHDRIR